MIFSQITKRQNICNYYYNLSTWSFLKCRNFQIVCSTFGGAKNLSPGPTRRFPDLKTHHATGELNHLDTIKPTATNLQLLAVEAVSPRSPYGKQTHFNTSCLAKKTREELRSRQEFCRTNGLSRIKGFFLSPRSFCTPYKTI